MITRIKHVSIPVKDQNVALAFYTNKLGFKLICDAAFEGEQRWIELEIPGADTQVVLFTPDGHQDRIGTFSNVIFRSEDVRKTYEQLKERGVEFSEPPTEQPWGIYAIFKDPDGNAFCLSGV